MATINPINSNIPIEIAKGGSNATSFATTDGTVIYDGTRLVTIATGSTGQVLTSNGVGVAPTYQSITPGSGTGWILIQTQTASASSSINFTSLGSYNTFALVFSNIVTSASAGVNLQFSVNGGSTYLNTGYTSGTHIIAYNGTTFGINGTRTDMAYLVNETPSSGNITAGGIAYLYNIGTTKNPYVMADSTGFNSILYREISSSYNTTTTAVNALSVVTTSGTITTGTFSLYGLVQ